MFSRFWDWLVDKLTYKIELDDLTRNVPFEPNAICDDCGKRGAFDFYGDFLCEDCAI